MPVSKVWIYRLPFYSVFVLFVCTVTYFSAKDKSSGVKFCISVQGRESPIWGTLLPQIPKIGRIASMRATRTRM